MARTAASTLLAMVFLLVSILTGSTIDPAGDDGQGFAASVVSTPVAEAKAARPVAANLKDPVRIFASHRAGGSKFVFDGTGPALAASVLHILAPEADLDRGLPPQTIAITLRRNPAHPVRAPPAVRSAPITLNG